jgi:hypothetical protein
MTDNRPPLGSAGRRDRRPPTLDLSASEFAGGRRWITWLPPDFPWGPVAVGAALLVLVVLVVALWPAHDNAALEARLARAEQQLNALAGRPALSDAKTVDDLAARLARLETPRPPLSDPALAGRLSALDSDLKLMSERLGPITRRSEEMALIAGDARQRSEANTAALAEMTQRLARLTPPTVSRDEIEALAARVVALERSAGAVETELRRRGGGATGDHSLRVAVAAAILRSAVERGDPFTAELKVAQGLAAEPPMLAPLEEFAGSGMPSAAALARELLALAPALLQGPRTPREAGFLDRLQASAEKLVRVRPVEEMPGDEPAAVVARIEVRAAQLDLAGALTELAKLPAPLRVPAQAWIAKAQARETAVEASRKFAADAIAALKG